MSCTVVAVPYALAWIVGSFIAATASTVTKFIEEQPGNLMDKEIRNLKLNNITSDTINDSCDDVQIIREDHFIEKDFDTPFTDFGILKKTLEEHGVEISEENDLSVVGQVDNYSLKFWKQSENEPYKLHITCLNNDKPEEKIDDLNSEYTLNVQEEAYLQIIDRLKANNMQVENEEVEDDNTIVITVNLD